MMNKRVILPLTLLISAAHMQGMQQAAPQIEISESSAAPKSRFEEICGMSGQERVKAFEELQQEQHQEQIACFCVKFAEFYKKTQEIEVLPGEMQEKIVAALATIKKIHDKKVSGFFEQLNQLPTVSLQAMCNFTYGKNWWEDVRSTIVEMMAAKTIDIGIADTWNANAKELNDEYARVFSSFDIKDIVRSRESLQQVLIGLLDETTSDLDENATEEETKAWFKNNFEKSLEEDDKNEEIYGPILEKIVPQLAGLIAPLYEASVTKELVEKMISGALTRSRNTLKPTLPEEQQQLLEKACAILLKNPYKIFEKYKHGRDFSTKLFM